MLAPVTVLIVDDQAAFRDVARMVVEMADGFELVGEATGGACGVAAASRLCPALVLMDMNMPDVDGFEATRQIVRDRPGTRVLMLSTHDPADFRDRALAAGAFEFVAKSAFDPFELEDAWSSVWTASSPNLRAAFPGPSNRRGSPRPRAHRRSAESG